AVLLALADHANDDGICWPGYTLLSGETYLSRASVSTAITNLSEMKLITIMEKSARRSTTYKLNLETDPAVIEANGKKAMDAAGVEPPVKTVRMGGKTYRSKATTTFNIEDEDAGRSGIRPAGQDGAGPATAQPGKDDWDESGAG